MKKKLLLISLLIAVFLIAFSVSVFAVDVVEKTEDETYGTVIKLNGDPGLDNAAQYVSTLKKINDAGTDKDALCIVTDGTYYYVFPASYIVLEREDGKFDITASDLAAAMAEFNTAKGTSYYAAYATTNTYAAKRLDALVRFEFTSDVTFAHQDWCCMRAYPNLVEVRINYALDLSSAYQMFYNNNASLTTVVGFENVTGLANAIFMYCKKLESVNLPTNITKIPDYMFFGTGSNASSPFTITNLSECTKLTTIGADAFRDSGKISIAIPDSVTTIEARAFQAGCKTGTITIGRNSKLQTIGDNAFTSCTALSSIYIPSSVTTIGAGAFHGCSNITSFENLENCGATVIGASAFEGLTKITTIKLPKNLTTLENAFVGNKNLRKVYIPKSVTTIADTFVKSAWENPPTNIIFVYTGSDASALSACTMIAGATVVPLNSFSDSTSYTGINIVTGYSHCVVYNNGNHEDISVALDFKSFYEAIGVSNTCACGVTEKGVDIPAIFTCQGFSIPDDASKFGISITYNVNTKAFARYTELSGNTLEYGVYAVLEERLGENTLVDENGVAANGVKLHDIKCNNIARYDFIITGFNTTEYQALSIAMGTFIWETDKNGVKNFICLQAKQPTTGNYYFVTYNAVKAGQQ